MDHYELFDLLKEQGPKLAYPTPDVHALVVYFDTVSEGLAFALFNPTMNTMTMPESRKWVTKVAEAVMWWLR